jgi:alkylation response protein AidB-like acyl-CoA dehydrogenase
MRWLGIASRSYDLMCEWANQRAIAPNGETLADRQVIQHWAAELDAEIRGARLQTLHAAWMIDQCGAHAAATRSRLSLDPPTDLRFRGRPSAASAS